MLKKIIFFLFLVFLTNSCSRKASDYSTLISTYKSIMCSAMNSTKLSKEEREKGLEKLASIKNDCRNALKFLKQEEKEKFHQMISDAEREVAQSNCN
jgi:hypothetical protein